MARSNVSFLVGTVPLVVAVLGMPGKLVAQSTGVLQATVRVVDYGSSLGALKAAQSTWAQAAQPQENVAPKTTIPASAQVLAVAPRAEYSQAELTAEPKVVTINYLR